MAPSRVSCFPAWLCSFLFLTASVLAANPPASTFIFQGGDNSNLTVSINVPANNTNDDLYFRLIAPASYSWYAFGFGTGMANSLIFVVYTSADGSNMTVSPRLGTGHVMPEYTSDVQVALQPGSGLINDTTGQNMVVNAQCFHCRSWANGKIDVTSTAQPMIYAVGGDQINIKSSSLTQRIYQHDGYGEFTMNLVAATGAGGVPTNTDTQSGVTHIKDKDDMGGPGSGLHALFMCGTFVVIFPAGYLFLRLFERVWVHIVAQSVGLFVAILGTGSGIAISIIRNKNPHMNSAHQAIGLILIAAVFVQYIIGWLHHRQYTRTATPSPFGKAHRFVGPAVMLIGIFNGALGFNFAGNNLAIIGYAVVVALMVIFVTVLVYFKKRRMQRKNAMNSTAAQNFREGALEPVYDPMRPEEPVPLQRYNTVGPQPGAMPSYGHDGR